MSTIVNQIIIKSITRDPLHQEELEQNLQNFVLISSGINCKNQIWFHFFNPAILNKKCLFPSLVTILFFAFVWSHCLFALRPFFHRSLFHKDSHEQTQLSKPNDELQTPTRIGAILAYGKLDAQPQFKYPNFEHTYAYILHVQSMYRWMLVHNNECQYDMKSVMSF